MRFFALLNFAVNLESTKFTKVNTVKVYKDNIKEKFSFMHLLWNTILNQDNFRHRNINGKCISLKYWDNKVTLMLLVLDKFSLSQNFFGFFLIHFLFISPVMSTAVFATIFWIIFKVHWCRFENLPVSSRYENNMLKISY